MKRDREENVDEPPKFPTLEEDWINTYKSDPSKRLISAAVLSDKEMQTILTELNELKEESFFEDGQGGFEERMEKTEILKSKYEKRLIELENESIVYKTILPTFDNFIVLLEEQLLNPDQNQNNIKLIHELLTDTQLKKILYEIKQVEERKQDIDLSEAYYQDEIKEIEQDLEQLSILYEKRKADIIKRVEGELLSDETIEDNAVIPPSYDENYTDITPYQEIEY